NAGKLQTRRDVYNLDSRTLAAIRSARGVIEPAPERRRGGLVASGSTQRKPAPAVRNGAMSQSMVYPTPRYATAFPGFFYPCSSWGGASLGSPRDKRGDPDRFVTQNLHHPVFSTLRPTLHNCRQFFPHKQSRTREAA